MSTLNLGMSIRKKLDSVGHYMTYKGTGKERMMTYMNDDEAFMSVLAKDEPPTTRAIQQSRYVLVDEEVCHLQISIISSHI